ncbi:MAG: hypothetical protein V1792_19530 [Pseudomonadota bacterium]
MFNLLDQLLGLTSKVMGLLLDWPFLFFVILVWLASRYRDQIGSALDRRGAIKRGELASAIRDELDPITRDLGEIKPEVFQLRTRVAKIEALQSHYASERLLKPVSTRVEALEESMRGMQSRLEEITGTDHRQEISDRLAPVIRDMEHLKETLDQLTQQYGPLNAEIGSAKQTLEEISERFEPLGRAVDGFERSLKQLESRMDETPQAATIRQLHQEMDKMGETLAGVTASVDLLKPAGENAGDMDHILSQPPRRTRISSVLKETDAIPLRVMKEALASTRWEWRRVKRLAGIAGLSEKRALEMLKSDPDLVVKKDEWGRLVAKLLAK